jgi:hypothetical protein
MMELCEGWVFSQASEQFILYPVEGKNLETGTFGTLKRQGAHHSRTLSPLQNATVEKDILISEPK